MDVTFQNLPSVMRVGDTVYAGVSGDGTIKNVSIADESILAPQGAIQQNPYYTNLMLTAKRPGATQVVVVSNAGTWYYNITVLGDGTTAATTTQQTTTTTTTSTTETTTTNPDNPQTQTLGDINRDQKVDASDAAEVLVAAARAGSGNSSGLSAAQERDADVDGSGGFDAQDAAMILRYAAAGGSGYKGTLEEYLKSLK